MSAMDQVLLGFSVALTPSNLLFCFLGVLLGTLIGVLPGLGPVTTIALLLPFTFSVSVTSAIIMLSGIYYGAQYGGSITAILVNLPGEASSAITCMDGNAMARQGRARIALQVCAIASFIGGTVGTLVVAALSTPLAQLAASFQAVDYVSLMICGLVAALVLAQGGLVKAACMVLLGLLLGSIGTGPAGSARFTFGIPELTDGVGFVPIALGLFGLAETIETVATAGVTPSTAFASKGVGVRVGEIKRALYATLRGTFLGSVLGVLPGGGPTLASFGAYALEKKISRNEDGFGKGAIEGIAGPEAANNAAAQTSFIPLLTMGFPSNPVMALLLGAMIVHGIQPGPEVIARQPELFWGLVVSMWVGNVLLLGLNLPFVGLWARLLRTPHRFLFPSTVALCCAGVYSLNYSSFEVLTTAVFGLFGYFMRRANCEAAPLLLGFVLSQPLEENIQRALLFAQGDLTTFVSHPVSAVLLIFSLVLITVTTLPRRVLLASIDGKSGRKTKLPSGAPKF
jgi:putative tricarboxylic transport membrane protein